MFCLHSHSNSGPVGGGGDTPVRRKYFHYDHDITEYNRIIHHSLIGAPRNGATKVEYAADANPPSLLLHLLRVRG